MPYECLMYDYYWSLYAVRESNGCIWLYTTRGHCSCTTLISLGGQRGLIGPLITTLTMFVLSSETDGER